MCYIYIFKAWSTTIRSNPNHNLSPDENSNAHRIKSKLKFEKEEFNSIIANNDGSIEALFDNLNRFLEN